MRTDGREIEERERSERRESLSKPPPCNRLAGWRNNPPAHLFRSVVRRVGSSVYLSTVAAEWRYFNCALILTTGRSAGSLRPLPLPWRSPSHDFLCKYIAGTTKCVTAYSEAFLPACPVGDNDNREYQPASLDSFDFAEDDVRSIIEDHCCVIQFLSIVFSKFSDKNC